MGWLKNLLSLKRTDVSYLTDLSAGGTGVDKRFRNLVNEGYKGNNVGYASIGMLSVASAAVPWLLFRRMADDTREEMPKRHILSRIIERPNPRMGHTRFFEKLIIYLFCGGKVYLYKATSNNEEPRFLHILRPDLMELTDSGDPKKGWVYRPPNLPPQKYKTEEILMLTLTDPLDDLDGLSPLEVSGNTIDQSNLARTWNRNLLKNSGRPPGILKTKLMYSKEQAFDIVDTFQQKVAGAARAGRPAFIKGDVDFVPSGFSPADMEWLAGQKVADRLTGITIGVNPQLLGDKDAATYANYREARKALYQERVVPLLKWIRDELNVWLVEPYDENLEYDLDFDSVEALQEDKQMEWSRVDAADWVTLNEKRAATRYEELPPETGDIIITKTGVIITPDGQILVPASVIPIETVGQGFGDPFAEDEDEDESDEAEGDGNEEEEPEEGEGEGDEGDGDDADGSDGDAGDGGKGSLGPVPEWQKGTSRVFPKFYIFGLQGDEAKTAHWKSFDRQRIQFFKGAIGLIRRRFQQERRAIVKAIRKSGTTDTAQIVIDTYFDDEESKSTWIDLLARIQQIVGSYFFEQVAGALPKNLPIPRTKAQIVDVWAEQVRTSVLEYGAKKVTQINRVSKKKIQRAILKGIEAEEGIAEIAARIDKDVYLKQVIPNRSEVIARTEVISASNAGSDYAAEASGLVLEKEWIATRDTRTRDTHKSANGDRVGMKEHFVLDSGAMLRWPGDTLSGAPAKEVINCRCVVGYHPI